MPDPMQQLSDAAKALQSAAAKIDGAGSMSMHDLAKASHRPPAMDMAALAAARRAHQTMNARALAAAAHRPGAMDMDRLARSSSPGGAGLAAMANLAASQREHAAARQVARRLIAAGQRGVGGSAVGAAAAALGQAAGLPPLQYANPRNPFGSMGSEGHFNKLGRSIDADALADDRLRRRRQAEAAEVKSAEKFTKALRDPIGALEKFGQGTGAAANAARAVAAGIRTFQAARGAYSWAYGVMQRGNPNMAGQMSGTMDLVNNRIAGLLSAPVGQVNAGIQGLVDARPGATIGTGVGAAGGGVIGAAIGSFLFPGLGTWAGGAIGATLGGMAGSAIGSYFAGERALPSMAGLPQPSMGDSASSWYDAAMMKTLALGAGTIEAENERRRIALLESQIGLLREISNNTRGTADFR